jgi:heme exporter protein A
MNAAASLALEEVSCVRASRTLFSQLSLTLQPGQLLRVHGDNGAGKTSLLRMICGLLTPSAGQVLWRGQRLGSLREEFGRELLYLGHAAALKDELSPLDNLQAASTLAGHEACPVGAMRALSGAGLGGFEHVPARRLSQGQRRRSVLARLALGGPACLWVLDEPFNALDSSAVSWLDALVRSHLWRGGMVVLTSHQDLSLDGLPHRELAL